ncbi:MAG: GNAT family protein [Bacillota bacterium]|jgi:RimJ/RimL family protein N-acetyltransferase|nr:GNAT family protein [Bacillota bacterium]
MKRVELLTGEELIIRRARPADAAQIIAYVEQVSGETDHLTFGRSEFGVTLEQETRFIEAVSKADNQLMICALLENSVVGLLNFAGGTRPRTRHTGEFGVSVLQEHWRKGIATELIAYLLQWARDTGIIRKINLRVRAGHTAAIRLYEKFGFVYQGRITREICINGKFYDVLNLGLEID